MYDSINRNVKIADLCMYADIGNCGDVKPKNQFLFALKNINEEGGVSYDMGYSPIENILDKCNHVDAKYLYSNLNGNMATSKTLFSIFFDEIKDEFTSDMIFSLPMVSNDDMNNIIIEYFFDSYGGEHLLTLPRPTLALYGIGRISGIGLDLNLFYSAVSVIQQGNVTKNKIQSSDEDICGILNEYIAKYNIKTQYEINGNSSLVSEAYKTVGRHKILLDQLYSYSHMDQDITETCSDIMVDSLYNELYFNKYKLYEGINSVVRSVNNIDNISLITMFGDLGSRAPASFDEWLGLTVNKNLFGSLPFIPRKHWESQISSKQAFSFKGWRMLNRDNAVFIGASIVGGIEIYNSVAITKELYSEYGLNAKFKVMNQ